MAAASALGDPAVTITVALVLFASFLLTSRRTALQWLSAVTVCGAVTAGGKLAIYVYGHPIPTIRLTSPSGHAAASVLVYGALSIILGHARQQRLPMALGALTVGLIAISRVYLRNHSNADVIVGAAIGGACLAWFTLGRMAERGPPVRHCALACVVISLIGMVAGWRLPIDPWLRTVAAHVTALGQGGDQS